MKLPAKQNQASIDIPAEFKDVFDIGLNMEGVIPRLPQIEIIHAGQMYKMPDESKVESFEAIILDQHPANAWWEKPASEGGGKKRPDCYSMDAVTPVPQCTEGVTSECCENRQAEHCANCSMNQFGSDPKTGKGKACKNMKRLHLLMEGSTLPRRLTVPPSSITSFEQYMTVLVDSGLPYPTVVTTFLLEEREADGNIYSELKFVRQRVLNTEEFAPVAEYIRKYKEAARGQEIQSDEYMSETNNTDFNPEELENDTPDSDIPY